jgi:hypothetical protein
MAAKKKAHKKQSPAVKAKSPPKKPPLAQIPEDGPFPLDNRSYAATHKFNPRGNR